MSGNGGTRTERKEAEWVIRQGLACVWVQAPNAEAGVRHAADRLGYKGAWMVGLGVDQEVFRERSTGSTRSPVTTRGR